MVHTAIAQTTTHQHPRRTLAEANGKRQAVEEIRPRTGRTVVTGGEAAAGRYAEPTNDLRPPWITRTAAS